MQSEQVLKYFKELIEKDIGETSREYEEGIVRFVDSHNEWNEGKVKELMLPIMENQDELLAFTAFYALCTFYRRHQYVQDYEKLLREYKKKFEGFKSYAFLKLMCDKMEDRAELESLIPHAHRLCAKDEMGKNYGMLHCFAELVSEACENDIEASARICERWMDIAMDRIDDAIHDSAGYAKFKFTKGRLLFIKAINCRTKDRQAYINEAMREINKSIHEEKIDKKMLDYQLINVKLQSMYYKNTLEKEIAEQKEDLENKVKEINVKNLEFLAFFAGIVSLIIGNIQIIRDQAFQDVAALIMVLTGCLITAFGAFGFILHGFKRKSITSIILVALGVAILVAALFYGGLNVQKV